MKFLLAIVLTACFSLSLNAQATQPLAPSTQQFGVIDKADLEMTSCDFEKDANAEILFDKGAISFSSDYERILERHIRVKIFNDNGKNEGNIKIRDYTVSRA